MFLADRMFSFDHKMQKKEAILIFFNLFGVGHHTQ